MQLLTVQSKISGQWVTVGPALTRHTPPGSISSYDPLGRVVYMFGWHEGQWGVWQMHDGVDTEVGELRVISAHAKLIGNPETRPVEVAWRRPGRPDSMLRFYVTESVDQTAGGGKTSAAGKDRRSYLNRITAPQPAHAVESMSATALALT